MVLPDLRPNDFDSNIDGDLEVDFSVILPLSRGAMG